MARVERIELPVQGMDCAECVAHVTHAIESVPGVSAVQVFLSSEKAVFDLDQERGDLGAVRKAIRAQGYSVPEEGGSGAAADQILGDLTKRTLVLFGVIFAVVLFVVVAGELLGLFEPLTSRIPWPVGLALVLVFGFPVFRNVIRAALQKRIIAHTLMTLGVIAALVIGEWATAALVVFFMRVGDYVESFTTTRARRAVKDLAEMAPQTARVERGGEEIVIPAQQVQVGEIVVVRPGEKIPVDGTVVTGQATVEQAAITGEAMPVEVVPGSAVYAATIAQMGALRVQAAQVGEDTTFGRVIRMVEEAEMHRGSVQRAADRFSGYYLPIVAGIAALTFLLRRDALATAAVLVVACSCSFALATPIAMLASIGAGARRGLLIKGGKYLEVLAKASVLLIDKTGTLTLGQPQITDVVLLNGHSEAEVLRLAASAERYSEHPLAEAVRAAARQRGLALAEVERFEALPGAGVKAQVAGREVLVGSRRLAGGADGEGRAHDLEAQGKTVLYVVQDGEPLGMLAATDTLRPEVPEALNRLREQGIGQIELLTGDNQQTAEAIAGPLGVGYRAGLLPEDKIRIVREYQAQGATVVMVGDGVNDAPALAQADVGIAMGAAGSEIAIEAAHIALMREDWRLIPEVFAIARRTMSVVRLNIGLTTLYNLAGLSLAALGFLPPFLAAAAQSIPDIGILLNSSRLLRQRR